MGLERNRHDWVIARVESTIGFAGTSPRLRESIHSTRLEDGLPVFVSSRPGFLKGFAIVATNYGSLDNEFVPIGEKAVKRFPEGIAHFHAPHRFQTDCPTERARL